MGGAVIHFCTQCGNQLVDEADFCTNCGARVKEAPSADVPGEPTQPADPVAAESKRSGMWFFAALFFVVLTGAGAAIYVFLWGPSESPPDTVQSAAPGATEDTTAATVRPPETTTTLVDRVPGDPSTAPQLVTPTDGAVFDHFPRITTLSWTPVEGASAYEVEAQFGRRDPSGPCCWAEEYVSEQTISTAYTFSFVGAQPGRWRVRTVFPDGTRSNWSEWWVFFYLN